MQDKINIKAPAKINLFLKILNKRKDGFHNIRSGITFINLFDEISIARNNKTSIYYYGLFSPSKGSYNNCIIEKTLKFLNIYNKVNLEIKIKKNIPVQAGLGSASSNAASLILGLLKLKLINHLGNNSYYSTLGADVPIFIFGKNCLVQGIGNKIKEQKFRKYYFLIIKPNFNFSTELMYSKVNKDFDLLYDEKNILDYDENNDSGNDFESIAVKEKSEIINLLDFLKKRKNCHFAQMTGSGSSCFAVFKNRFDANQAQLEFNEKFPMLWAFVGENNTLNNKII